VVGWAELGVVLEKEGGDSLVYVAGFLGGIFVVVGFIFFLLFLLGVGFDACVFGADYFFRHGEFACFLCFSHFSDLDLLISSYCNIFIGQFMGMDQG